MFKLQKEFSRFGKTLARTANPLSRKIYYFYSPNSHAYLQEDPAHTIETFPERIKTLKLSESLILLGQTNHKVHQTSESTGISDLYMPYHNMMAEIEDHFWPKLGKLSAEAYTMWLEANQHRLVKASHCKDAFDRLISLMEEDLKHSSLDVKDGRILRVNKRVLEPRVFCKIIKAQYRTILNLDEVSQLEFEKHCLEYIQNNFDESSINDTAAVVDYMYNTWRMRKAPKALENTVRKIHMNMADLDATGIIHFASFVTKFEQSQSFGKEKYETDLDNPGLDFRRIFNDIENKCYYIDANPDIELSHFARSLGFLGIFGKGDTNLWRMLVSFYWSNCSSFEVGDQANILDGFAAMNPKGEEIGTHHVQQILDSYIEAKSSLPIDMKIWFMSNFYKLKENKFLALPTEIFTEVEQEILQLDFNDLKIPRGLLQRLKVIIDQSSSLTLLKPKIERLLKA